MKFIKDFGDGTKTVMHNFFIRAFGMKLGFRYSPIIHHGSPYMTRWIVYLGPICFRLHKIFRGDTYRASHTHPFWFITFPFGSYWEGVYNHGKHVEDRIVYAHKFHWRPANFEHIIMSAIRQVAKHPVHGPVMQEHKEPFWTFVIASGFDRKWGFYDRLGRFTPYNPKEKYHHG